MVKPSIITTRIVRYLNTFVWLQSRGIQDPLKSDPVIASKAYPPNIITEYPPESLKIYTKDPRVNDYAGVKQNLCVYVFPFSISWVFNREIYKSYHQIPRSQIANLITKALQYVLISPQGIDEEVLDINLERCDIRIRPSEDINKQENLNSWTAIARFAFEVTFVSSPDEFVHNDYIDLQPSVYDYLDGSIQPDPEITLNGLRIELNQSELPSVTPGDEETYRLDEVIIIPPES